ncbi:serine hydrolase [Pedobacter sp. N36a]|nr:serine hydrolase domain-containing protein [Pedobacter sp. N36a]MBC8985326.1 serine hydrolase [Pedobacter sp. N36a]
MQPSIPILKSAEGYYQHPQIKELYLKMVVSGHKLHQIREWDGRELWLVQQTASDFSDAGGKYKLSFSRNNSNAIDAVTIGQEVWKKIPAYVPEKVTGLHQEQVRAILDEQADKLIQAINANSLAVREKYLQDNFSAALQSSSKNEMPARMLAVYRSTGGVKYLKNIYFNADAFFGEYQYLSEDLNNVYEFSIKLDKQQKVKLYNGRVFFNPDLMRKPDTEKTLLANLDITLKQLAQKDVFSGTVMLAKGGQVLYKYTCGSATKQPDLKNTADTRFNIGSMNKMFTAVGVMQLAAKRAGQ